MRRAAVLVCALGLLAGAGVYAYATLAAPEQSPPPKGNFSLAGAREFREFPLYWLGPSFGNLRQTAILRRDNPPSPPERIPGRFVSFLYGDCEPKHEFGCALPLEVQSWPACIRNPSVYRLTPDGRRLPSRRSTIRGVPAFLYEDGGRLEVSTGKTTVVLFGRTDLLQKAARALQPVSGRRGEKLPPPAPGALVGKLNC
jgi:hypothetical protein